MYWLNKIVWLVANPAVAGCAMLMLAVLIKKVRIVFLVLVLVWFFLWSIPAFTRVVGVTLERPYLVDNKHPITDAFPVCDAIADMGGGTGGDTNNFNHAFLNAAADRAYFSAMLWKAGKAPIIIPSGSGIVNSDRVFMIDLEIPDSAIVVENKARNTEENARFVQRLLNKRLKLENRRVKLLVVTSAWHMRRTLLMFEKYAPELEVIPAACDFECVPNGAFSWMEFVPNPEMFARNAVYFHEWIGYWWYKYFRK